MLFVSDTESKDSKMATNNNDDLLKQLIEAENSHDIEKLLALVTDDVIIEDLPFVPFGMVMNGKGGVRQGYAGFNEATPDFKIEPKSWITNDRSFASEWMLTATQKGDLPGIPASGKRFSIRGCSFREVQNGKLKEEGIIGTLHLWQSSQQESQNNILLLKTQNR